MYQNQAVETVRYEEEKLTKYDGLHYLVIIDAQGNIKEIELSALKKDRIFIGRDAAQNDIVLSSPVVSGRHGKIKLIGNHAYYADLGSTNGTLIEDSGISKLLRGNRNYCPLKDGTILKISYRDESVLILYSAGKEEGAWRQYNVELPRITIGRSSENDIVLNHPSVSRVHAILEKVGDGYVLSDNHSMNGVLVDGTPIVAPVLLKDKDVIQIFNSKLIYTKKFIYYKNSMEGISLEVKHVNKYVGKEKKQILRDVSCEIDSNEFVAIIGGSGAGKSTLMNAISGFDKNMTGEVYCNGLSLQQHFHTLKNLIGYVPQQDIIYENLTLRKMLYYTAKMKMPPDTGKVEIQRRIDDVLAMVELSEHQNTYIRKLSGGQKKRASIAVELLADPSLFFLDEPTSGLDPGTEKKLMQILSKLSKSQGKTIIMVTHTTQNLHLCDKVIFMGPGGRLCFCGNTEQAKMFFDTDDLVNIYNMIAEDPEFWAKQFANCMDPKENSGPQKEGKIDVKKKHVGLFRQIGILTGRYAELIWNDRQRLLLLLLQPILIAGLIAIVASEHVFYYDSAGEAEAVLASYGDTKSILFVLSCAGIWMGLFNSIQEICKERVILKREYMANLRLGAYMMSKYIVQLLLGFVQAVLITVVFAVAVGMPEKGILMENPVLEMFLVLWATILASMAMGFVVSGIVKNSDKAMTVAPFLLIIQLLFSGVLFKLEGTGEILANVTVSKWSVGGLGSIADLNCLYTNMKVAQDAAFGIVTDPDTIEVFDMFEFTAKNLCKDIGVLLLFVLICFGVCVLVLRNVSKDSR